MAGGRGRECFLRGVAACYAIAFASFYVQYDGLLGHAGLLPVDQFLRAASREADERAWARLARVPTVSWYSDALGCSVDELNRATALLGALLSSLIAASALAPSGVALAALVLLYLSLVSIGQTFFAFQWDTLLIEAGAVAAVYAAPLGGAARLDDGFAPGAWAARFLLFKLMLMAGMVKVQSECTTWLNLTALEFHFATQCLPTPLAWFAHSLPPPLLRLAVGATLLIEIPAAFLLLAPHAAARRVGVACQLLLQLPIALTGNYNWFNLLTALLTVPCWDVAAHPRPHRAAAEPPAPLRLAGWRDGGAAWRSLAVLWLAWSASRLFTLGWWASDEVRGADASAERWWARLTIALALSRADLDALVGAALRGGAALFALGLVVSSALHVRAAVASAPARRRARVQRGVSAACSCALALGLVAASSVPLRAIAPVLRAPAPFLALHSRVSALRLVLRAPAPFVALHSRVSALRLVSGYGLFRRMTGVAQRQGSASTTAQSRAGWGGQPPSAVARPELIIEVSRDHGSSWAAVEFRQLIIEFSRDHGSSWAAVEFRHKPGDTRRRPSFVAPHQPRLDWQMWFAALGSARQNPWLLRLMDQLVDARGAGRDLLDASACAARAPPPTHVRATLYQYDFTRMPSAWARRLPATAIFGESAAREEWWTRTRGREYVGAFERGDKAVGEFLRASGVPRRVSTREPVLRPALWPWEGAGGSVVERPSLLSACALSGHCPRAL